MHLDESIQPMSNGPEVVAGAGSLEELTRPFLEMLHQATGLESVYLTRIHWEDTEQEILFSLNTGAMSIPEGLRVDWRDTLCRRALLGGPSPTSNVPEVYGESQAARDLEIQTYVSCPIVQDDQTIWGTLCGVSASAVEVSEKDVLLMRQVAGLIAERVARERVVNRAERAVRNENARLEAANQQLEVAATTDQLTGIGNRRGFEARWQEELSRSRRYQYPVALILIDLDGFKEVNDRQGHAAGDTVLRAIAGAMVEQLRDIDFLARLGGDEFVVGLSHADTLEAEHICNRLRAQVAALDYGDVIGPPGFSAGIASSASTAATDLLGAADRALYIAKDRGGSTSQTWLGDLAAAE